MIHLGRPLLVTRLSHRDWICKLPHQRKQQSLSRSFILRPTNVMFQPGCRLDFLYAKGCCQFALHLYQIIVSTSSPKRLRLRFPPMQSRQKGKIGFAAHQRRVQLRRALPVTTHPRVHETFWQIRQGGKPFCSGSTRSIFLGWEPPSTSKPEAKIVIYEISQHPKPRKPQPGALGLTHASNEDRIKPTQGNTNKTHKADTYKYNNIHNIQTKR